MPPMYRVAQEQKSLFKIQSIGLTLLSLFQFKMKIEDTNMASEKEIGIKDSYRLCNLKKAKTKTRREKQSKDWGRSKSRNLVKFACFNSYYLICFTVARCLNKCQIRMLSYNKTA